MAACKACPTRAARPSVSRTWRLAGLALACALTGLPTALVGRPSTGIRAAPLRQRPPLSGSRGLPLLPRRSRGGFESGDEVAADVLQECLLLLDDLRDHGVDEQKVSNIKGSLDKPFRIVMAGEFSSGKSTLINALSGKRSCETGNDPTTMRMHVEKCDGFELVDTMGTNTPDFPTHKAETFQEVQKADAVVLVVKGTSPVTKDEEDIIKELGSFDPPVIVAVTYWDALRKPKAQAECRARVGNMMQKALGAEVANRIFYMDAETAEENMLEGGSHDDGMADGFNGLQGCISTMITDKEQIKLRNALSKAKEALRHQLDDIDVKTAEALGKFKNTEERIKREEEDAKKDFKNNAAVLVERLRGKAEAARKALQALTSAPLAVQQAPGQGQPSISMDFSKMDGKTAAFGLFAAAVLTGAGLMSEASRRDGEKKDFERRKAIVDECKKEERRVHDEIQELQKSFKHEELQRKEKLSQAKAAMRATEKANEAKKKELRKLEKDITALQKQVKGPEGRR